MLAHRMLPYSEEVEEERRHNERVAAQSRAAKIAKYPSEALWKKAVDISLADSLGIVKSCPNPECRGGFITGTDSDERGAMDVCQTCKGNGYIAVKHD